MIDSILKILYEQGPHNITELADKIGCHYTELCDDLAELVVDKNVHLDLDGTFWFAREVAA